MLRRILDRLFGPKHPVPNDAAEDEDIYQEVVLRTFMTGKMHVANKRSDGSWDIKMVDIEEEMS